MARRMSLEVPGLADTYARVLLNEALHHIEDEQYWSFQLQENGWLTPGLLFNSGPGSGPGQSAGTITATPFSNIIQADATAAAAWQAYSGSPLLTQFQIRSPYYSLYNIIGFGTGNGSGYGTGGYGAGGYGQGNVGFTYFVIDRPWMEPGGSNLSYMVYQSYFAVPVPDFRRFIAARDTTNNAPMNFWSKTQKDLAVEDPERTIFDQPNYFVPYETDQRPGSSTLGYMLYELWPHPLSVLPYTFGYLRRGPSLVNPSDTVPFPITEEMTLWQAKASAYLFKEAQKGEEVARGSGADYKFLSQFCSARYMEKKKAISMRDRDLVDLYFDRWKPSYYNQGEPFSTINSQLNVGRF